MNAAPVSIVFVLRFFVVFLFGDSWLVMLKLQDLEAFRPRRLIHKKTILEPETSIFLMVVSIG